MNRAVLALVLAGCSPEPLAFRVVHAPDDDPYRGADRIVVALEEQGVIHGETEQELAAAASQLVISSLPFGRDLRLRVETRARVGTEDLVLARGRSFPFDYPAGGSPAGSPDVTIGALGFFGATVANGPESAPRAVLATDDGALVATREGRLWRYVAHYDDAGGPHRDGHARFSLESNATIGADAQWVAVPGHGLLARLGDRIELWNEEGTRAGQLTDRLLGAHGDRPAMVALEDGALLVGGGIDGPAAVTRVRVSESSALSLEPRAPLAEGLVDARAVAVRVRTQGRDEERVLVFGGRTLAGPSSALLLLDPGAAVPMLDTRSHSMLPPVGATAAALGTGLVAIVGGATASGLSDQVLLVELRESSIDAIGALERPFVIFPPRQDAAIAVIGEGLALIAGGTGDLGAPITSADLLEVPIGPADVSPTGPLPLAAAEPMATVLGDGSVLVVGEGSAAVYVPPRDPP